MDHKNETDEYLNFLCTLGLNGLKEESQRHESTKNYLTEISQELALNYYPSFIATNECMKNLSSDLTEVHEESDYLVQNIPKFCDLIVNFADESKSITKQWREASRMLQKHSTLLEFLEIPQMMETSLRTSNYEEVLRLDSYVRKLRSKYGSGITFLDDVVNETNKVREAMAVQLTKELKCSIQLPTCIKVVGHLRQLKKYSDLELRIKFLTVRDLYLQSLIKDVATSPPLFHLTRIIEFFRINLFDIATQYRAVFSSDDPLHNLNQQSNESNILSSWMITKVEQFFKILESDILACIETEPYFPYDSIIDPCYYFGQSMARIGFAIKPRLSSLFQRMCLKRFRFSLDKAEKMFQESLNNYSLNEKLLNPETSRDVINPLLLVAEVAPLKWLLNGILMSFNDIRLISSHSMGFQVTDVLNKSLMRSTEILLNYCGKQDQGASANVLCGLQELCNRFTTIILSHVRSCLEKLFPSNLLAKSMGLSHLEYKKVVNNPDERLIRRIEVEKINSLLHDYVKVIEVVEDDVQEYQFKELDVQEVTPSNDVTFEVRNPPDIVLKADGDEKNEFKEDGSDCKVEDSSSLGIMGDDDGKSHEIMTLEEQITEEE